MLGSKVINRLPPNIGEYKMSTSKALVLTDEQYNAMMNPSLIRQPISDTNLTPNQLKIVSSADTKSDKIRKLLASGLKRAEVAKALGIRYQHVRNVELMPLKRKA